MYRPSRLDLMALVICNEEYKVSSHIDPLLATTAKKATIQQPLVGNGSTKRHERNKSKATIALQQRSRVFYAVSAEIL
jgi:hypothetical protein